jgi:hypothetical protein
MAAAAASTSAALMGATPGSGRGKAKRSEVQKTTESSLFAATALSIIGRQKVRDEDDRYGFFLAEKMKSVPKHRKNAAQLALLSTLDDFM